MRIISAITAMFLTAGAADAADTYDSFKDRPSTRGLPATADIAPSPAQSWTSIWAAALAGYSMSNTDLSLDIFADNGEERETANLGKLSGFGGEGFDATVQLGGDVQIGRVVIGGWGEYSFGGTESSASVTDLAKLDVDQNDSYGAFGRIGIASGDTLFYGAGGYVWTEFDAKLTIGDESASKTFDFSGPATEVGMEHRFSPNIRGKLSARYTWLDEETVARFGDEELGGTLTAEPGVWSVRAGVVISTSGGLGIFSGN